MRGIPYGTSLLLAMSSLACSDDRPRFAPPSATNTTSSSGEKDAGGQGASLAGDNTSSVSPTDNDVSPTDNDVSPTDNDVSPTDNDVSPTDNDVEPDDKACKPGDTRLCALGGAKGTCAEGNQTCTEEGAFGECDVSPRSKDDCSIEGNDDDCDGTPNSDCPCVDGQTQSCGPDTDVGRCEYGVSTCTNSKYGACEGAVERAPRNCESTQDNDCDGVPDNTVDDTCKCVPGDNRECNKHPGFDGVGPCRPGNQTCELSEDGTRSNWSACTGDVAPQASDSCNEGDNSDCSGAPNTNCTCVAGETDTCGSRHGSKGICAAIGLTCKDDGTWPGTQSCMAAATTESCSNGLDDNCDGTPDDPSSCPCSQTPSPCVYGTCSAGAGREFTCNCTGTGYEGTLCDKPVALVVAGPPEATRCGVRGVSDNGTVVIANCEIGEAGTQGYFWTAQGWAKAATPDNTYSSIGLTVLTADGTKAAGEARSEGVSYGLTWSASTNTPKLVNNPQWGPIFAMSANGEKLQGLDPGGNLFVWTDGGASGPLTYAPNAGVAAAWSGDGTKLFTSEPGEAEGFRIWTSAAVSTFHSSVWGDVNPVAVSNDGTAMIGWQWRDSVSTLFEYNSKNNSLLQSKANCEPLSISSDGRYVLGKCPSGLNRWADFVPSTVQSLLASTGSKVTLRTDVEGRMSYNAKYVALPHTGNGIVVVHLPSP